MRRRKERRKKKKKKKKKEKEKEERNSGGKNVREMWRGWLGTVGPLFILSSGLLTHETEKKKPEKRSNQTGFGRNATDSSEKEGNKKIIFMRININSNNDSYWTFISERDANQQLEWNKITTRCCWWWLLLLLLLLLLHLSQSQIVILLTGNKNEKNCVCKT